MQTHAHTQKPAVQHESGSYQKPLYCFVLSCPWAISVLHQSAIIKINIFTAKGKRNNLYRRVVFSLTFSRKRKKGPKNTFSFLHVSMKAQFLYSICTVFVLLLCQYLKKLLSAFFSPCSKLCVKVGTFSETHANLPSRQIPLPEQ